MLPINSDEISELLTHSGILMESQAEILSDQTTISVKKSETLCH